MIQVNLSAGHPTNLPPLAGRKYQSETWWRGHNASMSPSIKTELMRKAHQLNNLLSIIQGNAELLLADFPAHHEQAEMLREISKACDQASLVTGTLATTSTVIAS